MQQILENELLGFCLSRFGNRAIAVVDTLSEEEAETWRMSLATFLVDESKQGESRVEVAEVDVPDGRDFKSVIYRDRGAGGTRKIVCFSFRDAAFETALPLLGVAIAVFTGKFAVGSIPQVAGILKTLWGKVIVLKPPADNDAMNVLESIVRVRAATVAAGGKEYPTTGEIERQTALQRDLIGRALSRLKSLAVVEAVQWAGQADDLLHPENRWKVKL
jgi:hypothetical protein